MATVGYHGTCGSPAVRVARYNSQVYSAAGITGVRHIDVDVDNNVELAHIETLASDLGTNKLIYELI